MEMAGALKTITKAVSYTHTTLRGLSRLSPEKFAFLMWLVTFLCFTGAGFYYFRWIGASFGVALWGSLVGLTIEHFLVFVPKKQALLIMNVLGTDTRGEARVRSVLSGFNIKYPWEQAGSDGYFPLNEIRIPSSEKYPAKDGPQIKADGSFVISPDPKNILQYYVSRHIVCDKILDKIRGFTSNIIREKTALEAREESEEIGNHISHYFSGNNSIKNYNETEEEEAGTDVVTTIEESYGIVFKELSMGVIDYEESYQKTLTTRANAIVLRDAANKIRERTDDDNERMSPSEAMDSALVIDGKTEKKIQKFEGFVEAIKAATPIIIEAIRHGKTDGVNC